jgi:hypothetical protein
MGNNNAYSNSFLNSNNNENNNGNNGNTIVPEVNNVNTTPYSPPMVNRNTQTGGNKNTRRRRAR